MEEQKFKVTAEEPGLSNIRHTIADDLPIGTAVQMRNAEVETAQETGEPIAMDVKYRVERSK